MQAEENLVLAEETAADVAVMATVSLCFYVKNVDFMRKK